MENDFILMSEMREIVQSSLMYAKKLGANQAEIGINIEKGSSVKACLGETREIKYKHEKNLGVAIYKDRKKGTASTKNLSLNSVKMAIEAAYKIAEYTMEDPFSGLADARHMSDQIPDLKLYNPTKITTEEAAVLALKSEEAALQIDSVRVHPLGSIFTQSKRFHAYGNSHGFLGECPSTRYSISCEVVVKSNNALQKGLDFSVVRNFQDLDHPSIIGKRSAKKAIQKLDPRKIKTCRAPVIFSAEIANGLLEPFVAAISGNNIWREASFLAGKLGERVFPNFIHIDDDPHLLNGLGSAPFDQEGVLTKKNSLVKSGILQNYILDSYSARKLGMEITGNAGGVHNLLVQNTEDNLDSLLKLMGNGLLVTELLGQSTNLITGDYSQGVSGFWIQEGRILYPVNEVVISGNLRDMLANIIAIGRDVNPRSYIRSGSILLDEFIIAGS